MWVLLLSYVPSFKSYGGNKSGIFWPEIKMSPGTWYQELLLYSDLVTYNLFNQRFAYDHKVVAANMAKGQWLQWVMFSVFSLEDNGYKTSKQALVEKRAAA